MKTASAQSHTAQEAHAEHLAGIEARLIQLTEGLKEAKATENPNWGDVGSLTHLEALLTEALAFQRGCEPEDIR